MSCGKRMSKIGTIKRGLMDLSHTITVDLIEISGMGSAKRSK